MRAPRLYLVRKGKGTMVSERAGEVVERGSLSELYVAHAPDALRLAFLLTGDRALNPVVTRTCLPLGEGLGGSATDRT
jgi:hypothetical protein